jgi:anionic cell wall polymer biosynthesis LytR-Cps2A-Psr (LCP) family protein
VQDFEDILADDTVKISTEIKFICVVHINKTTGKSFITVIPGNSIASIGGVDMPLSHVFYYAQTGLLGKSDFITSTVIANTGIIPDFHGSVDIDDFVGLADVLGDLKYDNDYRITIELEDGKEKVTVPIGTVDLTGETLKALLTYEEYPDKNIRYQVLIDVSELMLDSICKQFKPNIISKVRSMLKYVETDFTASDMNRVSSVFFSYENSQKTALPILGGHEKINDAFLFRINSTASVKKIKEFLN